MVEIKYNASSFSELELDSGQVTSAINTNAVSGTVKHNASAISEVTLPDGKNTSAYNIVPIVGGIAAGVSSVNGYDKDVTIGTSQSVNIKIQDFFGSEFEVGTSGKIELVDTPATKEELAAVESKITTGIRPLSPVPTETDLHNLIDMNIGDYREVSETGVFWLFTEDQGWLPTGGLTDLSNYVTLSQLADANNKTSQLQTQITDLQNSMKSYLPLTGGTMNANAQINLNNGRIYNGTVDPAATE